MAKKRPEGLWSKRYQTLDILMSGSFRKILVTFLVITGVSFATLCVLGWVLANYGSQESEHTWPIWDVFIMLTNPGLKDKYSDYDAYLMVATNVVGILLVNGLLLTIVVNWVSERRERFLHGKARYDNIKKRKFILILGGHRMIAALVRDLLKKEDIEYVLIQTQRHPESLRKELRSVIDETKRLRDVVIYSGDRVSKSELSLTSPEYAHEIYILGEDPHIDGDSHDALNMQCWHLLNELVITKKHDSKIACHVMFDYLTTLSIFQSVDLNTEQNENLRFVPFGIYELWAQQTLTPSPVAKKYGYLPLDGPEGINYESSKRVHLIIVGASRQGISLLMEAARIAHYPNFNNKNVNRPRTLLTIIDPEAHSELRFLRGRYPALFDLARWRFVDAPTEEYEIKSGTWEIYNTSEQIYKNSNKVYPWNDPFNNAVLNSPYYGDYLGEDFIDIDFEFLKGDITYASVRKYLEMAAEDSESITSLAVCYDNASLSMTTAVFLPKPILEKSLQILVCQPESGDLVKAVSSGNTGENEKEFTRLKPFGMISECDYMWRATDILPRLIAYAYNALDNKSTISEEFEKAESPKSFIEDVNNLWFNMGKAAGKSLIARQWSNIYCANKMRVNIYQKQRSPEFTDDEVIKYAQTEHNRWNMEQLLAGFCPVDKSYASMIPIEDKKLKNQLKAKRIHPDLLSNSKLGKAESYDIEIVKVIPFVIEHPELVNT